MSSQPRKTERAKVSIWQSDVEGRAVRESPRTMSASSGLRRQIFAHASFPQLRKSPPAPLPLLPGHGTQSVPDPLVKALEHRGRLAKTKIFSPAAQVDGELLHHLF